MTKSKGAFKFDAWVVTGGLKGNWVAERLNVYPNAISSWRSGKATPQPNSRAAIEKLTNGAVPADSWVTDNGEQS